MSSGINLNFRIYLKIKVWVNLTTLHEIIICQIVESHLIFTPFINFIALFRDHFLKCKIFFVILHRNAYAFMTIFKFSKQT